MLRTTCGCSITVVLVLCLAAIPLSNQSGQAAELAPMPHVKPFDPLTTSAISALLALNHDKPPATGDELWKLLSKLGNFAQLPIVYSAVRLDSTLVSPRVVIAHAAGQLSDVEANKPNLVGRLYLAANMEMGPKGTDPRVTSIEFISWNTARRQFDFGVIENVGMGSQSQPELRIVDGGKCFACHKNRGPILGEAPWTNSTDNELLRKLVANKLNIVSVIPPGAAPAVRNRIDGMTLVSPEAMVVDDAVRVGRQLRIYRETFRLMNRSPAGRQAFLTLLEGILEPGVLDLSNVEIKRRLNAWDGDPSSSFTRFQSDWLKLLRTTNSGILIDFAPFTRQLARASNYYQGDKLRDLPVPPSGRAMTKTEEANFQLDTQRAVAGNKAFFERMAENMTRIGNYDNERATGKHDMPSGALPSNPKAFSNKLPPVPRYPSSMVNTVMLAGTIGLTSGDRHFMIQALEEAAERLKNKVTP